MEVAYHNVDPKAQRVNIVFKNDFLTLSSQYTISGQILILPITGSGAANMTFYDSSFNYTFNYKLINKPDGKEYANITASSTDLDVTKAYFHLDNLFNGNKELGDNMNKFLNDNAKEVIRDMGYPVVIELIQVLAAEVVQAIFSVVPYDELLPP
ncbi:unnamed protein product [Ceutorhynchus assimilis]|uniref:Uncharacterized protein n=1 Tax=Ceutorhynchus assimilis TaxID=467358 RepID=A0A9N9MW99_9CUCU|nr:unnamed protein product [Ceutorhynchus assimilis]